ncbi:MAG: ABC-type multidrug transport system, permease component [Bacilli bacterium]|nr:ABC-type multidrug transport system, permease component [Bacilli bacterium]
MNQTFWLTRNTLKVALRKKSNFFLFFVLPILFILLSIGIHSGGGGGSVNIGIADKDQSALSTGMIDAMSKENKFKMTVVAEKDKDKKLTSGELDSILIIPSGFSDSIYNNSSNPIDIISIKGEEATVWIKNYANIYVQNLLDIAKAAEGKKEVFQRIYDPFHKNPLSLKENRVQNQAKSKGLTSQSIGFLIMFILFGAGNVAQLILNEKKNRTYYRICTAPTNAKTYLAGNVLANLAIIIIQITVILLLITQVFNIQTYVAFYQLFLLLACFGLVATGLGLLIVAFSGNSDQVRNLQMLIIVPSSLLSGCLFPVDAMPKAVQQIADFLPQRWVMKAIESLQEGNHFDQIFIHLVLILSFALTFFVLAAYRFSRDENVKTFI